MNNVVDMYDQGNSRGCFGDSPVVHRLREIVANTLKLGFRRFKSHSGFTAFFPPSPRMTSIDMAATWPCCDILALCRRLFPFQYYNVISKGEGRKQEYQDKNNPDGQPCKQVLLAECPKVRSEPRTFAL